MPLLNLETKVIWSSVISYYRRCSVQTRLPMLELKTISMTEKPIFHPMTSVKISGKTEHFGICVSPSSFPATIMAPKITRPSASWFLNQDDCLIGYCVISQQVWALAILSHDMLGHTQILLKILSLYSSTWVIFL